MAGSPGTEENGSPDLHVPLKRAETPPMDLSPDMRPAGPRFAV